MKEAKNKMQNPFAYDNYLIGKKRHDLDPNGVHYLFGFNNNFGASVIQTNFSYGSHAGLWELCLMRKKDDGLLHVCNDNCNLPELDITGVAGALTEEEVKGLLALIKDLPID